MKHFEILIPKYALEKEILLSKFNAIDGTAIEEKEYKNYHLLKVSNIENKEEEIKNTVAETLLMLYKFRMLFSSLRDMKINDYDKCALLGALLGIDKKQEIKTVYFALKDINVLSLKALFDFRLNRITDNCLRLKEITKNLTINIENTSEVYELISYFITAKDNAQKITITDTTPLKLVINGEISAPFPFTKNNDLNVILTAVSEHPSHIVIKNQELLSEPLINTLRALGQ